MTTNSEGRAHNAIGGFIEESALNQAFKRAKDNLNVMCQRLIAVYSNYSEISSEVSKAVNQLADGKGFGHLVKILFLFFSDTGGWCWQWVTPGSYVN